MRTWVGVLTYRAALALVIFVITFVIVHATPGNPCTANQLADAAARADQERVCREFRLDQPMAKQLFFFYQDLLSGELRSWKLIGRPSVLETVLAALLRSLPILFLVTLLVWTTAFPVGVLGGKQPGGWFDRITGVVSLVILSIPSFLIAYALIAVAGALGTSVAGEGGVNMGGSGWASAVSVRLWHAALPSAVIAIGAIALLGRYVRAHMIAVLNEPFIDLAYRRGVPADRVYYHHALRNVLLPVITLFGLYLPWIVSGSLVVELVFAWPGIGRLAYYSFLLRDYPVVLTVNLLVSLVVLAGSTAADVLYRFADPRVRYQEGLSRE